MNRPGDQHGPTHGHPADEKPGFLDRPENVKKLLLAFTGLSVVVLLIDLVYHRHVVHAWEAMPGFYGIFGFLAIVFLVYGAKALRAVVMRSEDYYDA